MNARRGSTVWLMREALPGSPYVEEMKARGAEAVGVPLLSFEMEHEETLREKLAQPEQFDALVLTSPRTVTALQKVWTTGRAPEGWLTKRCLVVGPATADGARALGFSVEGEEAGTGASLAGVILGHTDVSRVLFPSARDARMELYQQLSAAGVEVEKVSVYRTSNLSTPVLPEGSTPDWLVFFSPSGVAAAVAIENFPWNARAAAIGPTTAQALRQAGHAPSAVAETPDPPGLAHALHGAGAF